MQPQSLPDEPGRLAALHRYRILDTPVEREFDEMARLASTLCETPFAAISLVDRDRQWFKAEVGFGVRQTGLDVSFCSHAIRQDGLFEIPDARLDRRFAANPAVTGAPGLRFYAAALLKASDGHAIGTLCVMDVRVRRLSAPQRLTLQVLANQVMVQLELRRLLTEQRDSERRAREGERTQRFLLALEDALSQFDDPGAVMRTVGKASGSSTMGMGGPSATARPEALR